MVCPPQRPLIAQSDKNQRIHFFLAIHNDYTGLVESINKSESAKVNAHVPFLQPSIVVSMVYGC